MNRKQLDHFAWFIECYLDHGFSGEQLTNMFGITGIQKMTTPEAITKYLEVNKIELTEE